MGGQQAGREVQGPEAGRRRRSTELGAEGAVCEKVTRFDWVTAD